MIPHTTISTGKKRTYTYADYARLPEGAPYQLINGNLIMSPAPIPYHQRVSGNIEFLLRSFVKNNNLGEVYYAPIDIYLGEQQTYQPDIIFISKKRLHIIGEKKIEGAPDLVIEILSESTAYYDLKHKKNIYEKTGVKEYWIVDPADKSIEIFVNKNGRFVLKNTVKEKGAIKSELLKGFKIDLRDVF